MPYINLSAATKTLRAAAILNAVGANAVITIYTGAHPASPDIAPTGIPLVVLTGSAVFGVAANGGLTANTISQGTAIASGLAGWARIATSSGVGIIDLDVGIAGAGVIMNTVNVIAGGPVQITSLSITEA